ncbi:MAG: hypothetical protein U9Q16_02250 [Patescibacteria group bacterium]|nr:hypothetical protein [Patescibacteria group bacterium]
MATSPRKNRTICIPFCKNHYIEIVKNPILFREYIDRSRLKYPELFPTDMEQGYRMKEIYFSKKLLISIRRITINDISYTIRPSFAMPYMTAFADDVEKPLFLRKFNIPFWAIAHVFGKDAMYWYRLENHIGRNSVVGTTIKKPELLPEHIVADEKHSRIKGEKCYIATTAAFDCILGVSIAKNASEISLTKSYGVFLEESQRLKPDYSPTTVNIDGWPATKKAWKTLFTSIVVICCFLHVFIKIRDRSKNKYKNKFIEASTKLWYCYEAVTKRSFSQRIRRLTEWTREVELPDVILKPIIKLKKNIKAYSSCYEHEGSHRTSNMIDRLMQRMDRHLFSTQYFHGNYESAELNIRGWALISNFAPSNPATVKKYNGKMSPAERLNGFSYHDNWLQNLMVSASLNEFRPPPLNPL